MMLFFTRAQFTDEGRFKHSLKGEMDFEEHLLETGASDESHAEMCRCPRCQPSSYQAETCPLCATGQAHEHEVRSAEFKRREAAVFGRKLKYGDGPVKF